MDGTTAQIIALTCYGNKFLQDGEVNLFFPDNSTCQYCQFVKFVEWNKDDNDVGEIKEIAGTPNGWFIYLKSKNAVGIKICITPQNEEVDEDRSNAGFVDGGVIWEMVVTYKDGQSEIWRAKWETSDDHPPGKLWQVTYRFSKLDTTPDIGIKNIDVTSKRLIKALENIKNYSEPHESLEMYTERFSSALNVMIKLDHKLENKKYIYHDDLFPEGILDEKAMAILSACQMTEIFGWMGSWNDLPPHDGTHDDYKKVSDEMYLAMNEGFVVATNSSFKL
ncbi:MAG: hypothetical protein ACTSRE_16410 [Promethearchaeota archaeon]